MSKAMKHMIVVAFMLLCVFFLLMLWGTHAFPQEQELKTGEAMPSLEGYVISSFGTWFNPADETKRGSIHIMAKAGEDNKYFVVYNICDDEEADRPFGIMDYETGILYLDHAPTDGCIDDIVPNPTGYIYEVAPDCKEQVST